jgi:hypothetical protein
MRCYMLTTLYTPFAKGKSKKFFRICHSLRYITTESTFKTADEINGITFCYKSRVRSVHM